MPDPTKIESLPDTQDPDPQIPGFFICYGEEDRPWIHTPLERGIFRWVREQAYQAAHDPDRDWHGAVAEYQRLKEGTHPDPNPAAIIFPDQPELYDPHNLDIDYSDFIFVDQSSAKRACHPSWNDGVWQPWSPQREATQCYKWLDSIIFDQELGVAQRADYDAHHPDEIPNPDYYRFPGENREVLHHTLSKPTSTKTQRFTQYPDQEITWIDTRNRKEERPWIHTPLERGIIRWVREQAYQAAHNPDREWHGAIAEYNRLKAGVHSDPNPAAIIFPDQPELYDPRNLEIDYLDMKMADYSAERLTCHPIWNNGEWQPRDPQKEAAACYKELDGVITAQELRVAQRADYDVRHPDEIHTPDYYRFPGETVRL